MPSVSNLVQRGMTQAAFRRKSNALAFQQAWRKKGYKVGTLRSSGPTVEGGYKRNAYYVIAEKRKQRMNSKPKRRRQSNYNVYGMRMPRGGIWG